ncbi:TonB-dependent receptor [Pseudoflavitalea sp. X16]|uniref:SusC/RagA family TonB-linked outer membrane protein n=1 Tax=Paraflavitalea devenefica TaxID=2716334 RepID=UPI00141FA529|nr:TonB-dependent receptor [Paraflavitalea devenefica]NII27530.1 TonB-dependent receptor [Paraflavitalea devenefica]
MKKVHSNFRQTGWLCLLLLFFSTQAFAQTRMITGKVTDSKDSIGLPGVSVQAKGALAAAQTGSDGTFRLEIPQNVKALVFSFVGYDRIEVPVGSSDVVNALLTANSTSLQDVVVIGYGTQRKSDLTGAVGSVRSAQLAERPAVSLNQALAGRIPGVQVNTNSGRPGGQSNVRIRGFSSINSSNNPLYVIDGVIIPVGTQTQNSNAIDYINPSDVAAIEVLKDASATAIYGARGANGVILVSTKRGSTSGGRVTYDVELGVPTIGPHRVKMLNAKEYVAVEDLAYDNIKVYDADGWAAGNYTSLQDPREKRKNIPSLFDANGDPLYNTDWLKASTQNKLSQNHQVSFSNGNADNNYGVFLGYRNDNGLLLNSYLKRYSGRFVFDSKIKSWLKVGGTLGYNNQKENIVDQGTGGLNSVRMITEGFPFLPVKYPNGKWADNADYPDAEGGSNPVHILNERKFEMVTQTTLGNVYADIYLAKGLELRTILGAYIATRNVTEYNGRSLSNISLDQRGTSNVANGRESYWSSESYLTYKKKLRENDEFTGMLGISWQETNIYNNGVGAENFSTDYFQANNLGASSKPIPGSSNRSRFAFNSYFGRFNYVLNDKYLLTLTGRVDGSSKFGKNHKYAFFPSAALAWRVSDEDFMRNSAVISNMKLRASVGVTGNSEIPTYSALSLLGSDYAAIINNTRTAGVGLGRLGNPDLRWEKTTQTDLGLEVGLWGNRVLLEADVYYRKTTDMLLNAPVPRSTGYPSIYRNIGSMENKGLEISIGTVNISTADFTWSTAFNISMNKNKVLALATPADIFGVGNPNFTNQTGIIRVGEPVGSFWGLTRLGTWGTKDADEAAKFSSYRGGKDILPGDIRYLDVNGDSAINDADRSIIGNGNPDGWGSLFNTFKYKNFELTVELQYVYGNDVLNMTKHSGEDRQALANSFASVLNAWTPDNQNTPIAAIRNSKAGYVTNVDTHWMEDGSFIRGKNILLGYTFAPSLIQRLRLSKLRVYASVQNFFLATKFSGNDPEVTTYGQPFAQGQTFFDYPKPTTYTLGVNVSL